MLVVVVPFAASVCCAPSRPTKRAIRKFLLQASSSSARLTLARGQRWKEEAKEGVKRGGGGEMAGTGDAAADPHLGPFRAEKEDEGEGERERVIHHSRKLDFYLLRCCSCCCG